MEPRQLVTLSTTGVCLSMAFAQVLASKGSCVSSCIRLVGLSDLSTGDVSGLIFGSVTKEKKSLVTDSGSRVEMLASIDMQVFDACNFFDGHGNIESQKIAKYVTIKLALKMIDAWWSCCRACEAQKQTLVGWFSFRSNAPLRPSSREMVLKRKILYTFDSPCSTFKDKLNRRHTSRIFSLRGFSQCSGSCRRVVQRMLPLTRWIIGFSSRKMLTDSQEEYGSFTAFSKTDIPSLISLQQSIQVPPPTVNQIENYAEAAQGHINMLVAMLEKLRNDVLNESREVEGLQAQYAAIKKS
eukprot:96388-Hanusia_phi.AAC.4